jgi:hypothetical protein
MKAYPVIDKLEADMNRPTVGTPGNQVRRPAIHNIPRYSGHDAEFETLRRKRDDDLAEIVHGLFAKERAGMEIAPDVLAILFKDRDFHAKCYCGCPNGPCQHDFTNWRADADGSARGGDHVCVRCGLSWRRHALRVALKHPPTD